ncbi:PREDICTED: uncharacterized protein LOC105367854 [Ceratosolen solmsi marchali]|uniref:Uncharacterized protein LOC105367854 n=1 Tax=Ceratosolen solmsi marchali TaxID=326594 RepID=A0AAJ6YV83_9HYME|nr:PREDICTED: uncharacterized protein LOC105367854 [Ceratosolen solmsi marchali]
MKEINVNAFVNCEHVQQLFSLDRSMFDLGSVLHKCWHHGTTLDEINGGLESKVNRPDIENYEFQDLHLPCDEVFRANLTRLSTSLLQDFIGCRGSEALAIPSRKSIESRFGDIVEVYQNGNMSVTIDEGTLVSCANFSKRVSSLCLQYGLTEDQWSRGFLRYNYPDKWVVEESVHEMSLTCDQVFRTKLYLTVYEEPTEMFIKCQKSMSIEPEVRDVFEKKYAQELQKLREQISPDEPGVDLRGFVSCRHLQPVSIGGVEMSASQKATNVCRAVGLTYEELQNGTTWRADITRDEGSKGRELVKLYLDCDSVFDEGLRSFTSALLNDYESCRAADKVSLQGRRVLWRRFSQIFELFASKLLAPLAKHSDQLVRCTDFKDELVDLCRRRGSSLAQELRGFGSLARSFGDKWLNTEELDKLYLSCEELLDEAHARYVQRLPIDQYMQCRWIEGLSDPRKALIDKSIARLYERKHGQNATRYKGDADVEISSVILFDQAEDRARP